MESNNSFKCCGFFLNKINGNTDENSLQYWLKHFKRRFKTGKIYIGTVCVQSFPCHHLVKLEYQSPKGILTKVFPSIDCDGRTILKMLNRYPNAMWYKSPYFDHESTTHPLEHFRGYS